MIQLSRQARGFTLTQALIALAVLGGVSTVVVTKLVIISQQAARTNIAVDADQLVRSLQLVMMDRGMCRDALKNADGSPASFDGTAEVDIHSVSGIDPSTALPTPLVTVDPASEKNRVRNGLRVSRIFLRPRAGGGGEYMGQNGLVRYRSLAADLVVEFATAEGTFGGALKPRIVPVNIAARQDGTDRIDDCPSLYPKAKSKTCGVVAGEPCPVNPPGNNCTQVNHVAGFTQDGDPLCRCSWVCE